MSGPEQGRRWDASRVSPDGIPGNVHHPTAVVPGSGRSNDVPPQFTNQRGSTHRAFHTQTVRRRRPGHGRGAHGDRLWRFRRRRGRGKPGATASRATDDGTGAGGEGGGEGRLPADLADRLKEHGIDVDEWKKGGWKDWDKDKWLSEAKDFVNPKIEGLWKPDRMKSAEEADKTISTQDAAADQGVSDPEPAPVEATAEKTPYHQNAAPVGKVFFDSPRARWSARARSSRT